MAAPFATSTAPEPTLRTLLGRTELGLKLTPGDAQADPAALDRPVRWVHSSDLADPTPFLSAGLVLLTTGTQFSPDTEPAVEPVADPPAEFDAYVERLRDRGVVGLGFGTQVVRAGVPAPLVDACRRAGMPLFEVPFATPFIAVAQAAAEAIAAQAYARRSWALAAQRSLALAALRPDGLGAALGELARQLHAWVGLFDAGGALVREHPEPLDLDTATALSHEITAVLRRGGRSGTALTIGGTPFTLQSLGRGGRLRGVLAVAADEVDQQTRGLITTVVAMAGLGLEQQQSLHRARAQLRTGVLQTLLSGDLALPRRIARDLWGGLPHAPILVAVTDAASARSPATAQWLEHAQWLEQRAEEQRGGVFFARGDDGLVIIVRADGADLLSDFAAHSGASLGVSTPADYGDLATALAQAGVARDHAAQRLAQTGSDGAVVHVAELTASGIFGALDAPRARALAAAELGPVLERDSRDSTALVDTLRAWLRADCSNEATAAALAVHRHTVRTRLAVIQRLLDRDLSSFSVRAQLWAALRVLDTAGAVRPG